MTQATQAPRRSDAQRNRDRIIAAALDVFAEKGLAAGVPEIAERAGVGKATVYRNYPTKADLVAAVAADRLEWLARRADQANAEPDAWVALRSYVEDVLVHVKSDRALCEALRDGTTPATQAPRRRIRRVMAELITRGQEQGTIRADVTPDDLRVVLGGITEALHREGETNRRVWRRHAHLVADMLRVPPT